jgi:AcrR family transcriptional regulator
VNDSEQSDRRKQILDAALKVFSRKGYQKATNKDIAEAAGGISPGLIYHYFKDKQDLLFSVLRDRAAVLELAEHPEQLMELPIREGLALVARTYMGIFKVPAHAALMRIVLSEALQFPQLIEMFYRVIAVRFFRLLQAYIQVNIESGVLRSHDTSISARVFIGMLVSQVIAREVIRQPEAIITPDDAIIAMIVEIFVRGLAAD